MTITRSNPRNSHHPTVHPKRLLVTTLAVLVPASGWAQTLPRMPAQTGYVCPAFASDQVSTLFNTPLDGANFRFPIPNSNPPRARWARIYSGNPSSITPVVFVWHGTGDICSHYSYQVGGDGLVPACGSSGPHTCGPNEDMWAPVGPISWIGYSLLSAQTSPGQYWTLVAPFAARENLPALSAENYPWYKSNTDMSRSTNDEDNVLADLILWCLANPVELPNRQNMFDIQRIFSFGYSAGAWQSSALGVNRNEYVGATFLISGALMANQSQSPQNIQVPAAASFMINGSGNGTGACAQSSPPTTPPTCVNLQGLDSAKDSTGCSCIRDVQQQYLQRIRSGRNSYTPSLVQATMARICTGAWSHSPPPAPDYYSAVAWNWFTTHRYDSRTAVGTLSLPPATIPDSAGNPVMPPTTPLPCQTEAPPAPMPP